MPAAPFPDDPKHWRERADEARAVAEIVRDPDAKQAMLKVAEGYERLVKLAEEEATSPRSAD
jgi:hypothetical protein